MATRRTVRLGELGSAMSDELRRLAVHNQAVADKYATELYLDAEREAISYYPQVLGVISGDLQRETAGFREDRGQNVAVIGLRNRMEYAAIQEHGGTTEPHVIQPKFRKALFIPSPSGDRVNPNTGETGFVRKSVNHPGSTIPATRFLSTPLRLATFNMLQNLKQEVGFPP